MKTIAGGALRLLITLLLLAAALWIGRMAWNHYMQSPWTRDGRIKADIINVSADVSGNVVEVPVHDNQLVHKGDVLFSIDNARYIEALAQAEAVLAAQKSEQAHRSSEARRRASLDSSIVSAESREGADFAVTAASAQYQGALAARNAAKINLDRTVVRAPATGYITNLNVFAGSFAAVGAPKLAIIGSETFYVVGYFEENKLALMRDNDPVEMTILGDDKVLRGHIESVARGITDRDANSGRELLADVNPTFNWVRLAQRVPVRIHIDSVPEGRALIAGTTCTVVVKPAKLHSRV
ncbi:biotin/lipoyl-binding protein [Oxalobacteraceae bacterium CAVE-383]|nr:biotin/lipoyl-binding protein [Oxalobacteraceae bacterium CAVE-383]